MSMHMYMHVHCACVHRCRHTGTCVEVDPAATLDAMKRIAILGATGSVGRQALEVCDANPELEVCALASGTSRLDGLAREYPEAECQVGGDLVALLERTRPDVVLNAVVGFAGLPATLWALERGVTLALANKESLVAAGELPLAAQRRGGGGILPRDRAPPPLFPCPPGRDARQGHS